MRARGQDTAVEHFDINEDGQLTLTLSSRTRDHLAQRLKATDEMKQVDSSETSKQLNQVLASGICGNNITSSCLYVVALCAAPAGANGFLN